MKFPPDLHIEKIATWMTIIGFPVVILGGIVGYFQLHDYLVRPELSMQFGIRIDRTLHPVEFLITNNSAQTAEEPYYGFVLRDFASPHEVLPIPWNTTTFIKPAQSQGFNELMEKYGQPDHRYFGTAMITCNNCGSIKNYFLYIDNKDPNNGFFYLLNGHENIQREFEQTGDITVFPNADRMPFSRI